MLHLQHHVSEVPVCDGLQLPVEREIADLVSAINRMYKQRHLIPGANYAVHTLILKLRDARKRYNNT